MAGIEPNNDFLKHNTAVNKPIEVPSDKPIPKMETKPPAKKTKAKKEKKPADWKDVKVKSNPNTNQPKKKMVKQVVVSQEQYDLEKAKYPEYFALSDYHKKCLIATNYWRVLNGKHIIEVPALYTYYHKYFDKRCYELAVEYQERNKRIAENKVDNTITDEDKIIEILVKVDKNEMYAKDAVKEINEINGVEPIVPEEEEETVEVINISPEPTAETSTPEVTEEQITEIYNEAVEKFPTTMEKLEDKKDNNEQLSLF